MPWYLNLRADKIHNSYVKIFFPKKENMREIILYAGINILKYFLLKVSVSTLKYEDKTP